jgi:hypothetical protein
MQGKEIYKIWAPTESIWTKWIRCVPFINLNDELKPAINWVERDILFLKEYDKETAIFVDMPGEESIEFGIGLAKKGFRPIPLFNETDEQPGSKAIINSYIIENSLLLATQELKSIKLDANANPAFLLDSTRSNRQRANTSIFDNSWDLYGQDIPSYNFFLNHGIKKIIIITNKLQTDLKKIFIKFQKNGINFYLTNGYDEPQKTTIKLSIVDKLQKEDI